jgi:peptide/nickel transport system ATP-binding protein
MTESAHCPALELVDLEVSYSVRAVERQVLRGVSLKIERGRSYGLVGESGCGKSTAALAIVRYLPRNGRVCAGEIRIAGRDVVSLSRAELRRLRANDISMVYQDPGSALNPSMRVGDQVAEAFVVRGARRADVSELAREALTKVQIGNPSSVMARYPHQLSGGMQQRVLIAVALAKDPALLILDEPTTGLDATVEAEVLDLVAGLQAEFHTAVLFISHNLGVIAKMCERVGVLYAGRLVEEGPAAQVLHEPRHPYTVGLLRCIPRAGARKDQGRLDTIAGFLPDLGEELPMQNLGGEQTSRCHFPEEAQRLPRQEGGDLALPVVDRQGQPLLRFDDLGKVFRQREQDVHALAGVSAAIWPGETLGLVGESGSGKTTLARVLLGLVGPTTGSVTLEGRPLSERVGIRSLADIRKLQIIFQNPGSALNRRHSVRRTLGFALNKLAGLSGPAADERTLELLRSVRIAERYLSATPNQLSGGLKQRLAIARAFAGTPQLVVCDEPTSSLDVSVQAAILNLLLELQAKLGVAYLFISHDLGVVRYISDRIAVLYLGRLMELGPADVVFDGPHHPYTEALLSAVPTVDGGGQERIRLPGEISSVTDPSTGCVFHTRCHRKIGRICEIAEPPLVTVEPDHMMRCHIPIDELRLASVTNVEGEVMQRHHP